MRYRSRNDVDENGGVRSECNQKMDSLGMTPINTKSGRSMYENPKESLYFPAPYATSRLATYAPEDGGSECDSLPSSTRTAGDQNMTGHTYDVPFPVIRPDAEEQYTRIKRVPAPSVPTKNIYQAPQQPEAERWPRRLSYQTQGVECALEPSFSYKVGSPAARRWSGGYRVPFHKDHPFKLKRIDREAYRYSDETSDMEDEDDRPGEVSEAECDRSHLTVMIPPENKNFYMINGTVQ